MSYANAEEAVLYRLLRKDIQADLIGNGIPSNLAGAVISFYDPANDDYLQRVDAWQSLLCSNVVSRDLSDSFPQAFVDAGVIKVTRNSLVLTASCHWVEQIHQVVKLLYKYHGVPRKDTDWEEVKNRFRHPGHITLDDTEIEAMRSALSVLKPPSWYEVVGRFGPGISADGKDQYDRWAWDIALPERVPPVIYDLNLIDFKLGRHMECDNSWFRYGITKVAEVPKSIKTNRFVSSEPAGCMYAQLAVGDALVKELHRNFPYNVSLYDQQCHNRLLTQRQEVRKHLCAIKQGHLCDRTTLEVTHCAFATIDLSDASDHVSRSLVWRLLPQWRELLFSVRSTFAGFPDGEIVPLRTFAPMGSGVCFPVLTAIVLSAIAVAAREFELDYPGTKLRWSVYGDDAIVPIVIYRRVCELLTKAGLVQNEKKSCATGCYRESCGKEFITPSTRLNEGYIPGTHIFADYEITPVMIREHPGKVSSSTLEQWLSKLSQRSWVATTGRLWDLARKGRPRGVRWNQDLQRLELLVTVEVPSSQKGRNLPGWCGLVRWFSIHTQRDDGKPCDIYLPSRNNRLKTLWGPCSDFPLLTKLHVNAASPEEKQREGKMTVLQRR